MTTEAEQLAERLAMYRAVKDIAKLLRLRLLARRDETYFPGAKRKPTTARQPRLF